MNSNLLALAATLVALAFGCTTASVTLPEAGHPAEIHLESSGASRATVSYPLCEKDEVPTADKPCKTVTVTTESEGIFSIEEFQALVSGALAFFGRGEVAAPPADN